MNPPTRSTRCSCAAGRRRVSTCSHRFLYGRRDTAAWGLIHDALLPEALQAREQPSPRRPLAEIAGEGRFAFAD